MPGRDGAGTEPTDRWSSSPCVHPFTGESPRPGSTSQRRHPDRRSPLRPGHGGARPPFALVAGHPGTGVKEETSGTYAQLMAEGGYVTLAVAGAHGALQLKRLRPVWTLSARAADGCESGHVDRPPGVGGVGDLRDHGRGSDRAGRRWEAGRRSRPGRGIGGCAATRGALHPHSRNPPTSRLTNGPGPAARSASLLRQWEEAAGRRST